MDASSNQKQKLPRTVELFKSSWENLKAGLKTYGGFILLPFASILPLLVIMTLWAIGTSVTNESSVANAIIGVLGGFLALVCLVLMIVFFCVAYTGMMLKAGNPQMKFKEAVYAVKKQLLSIIFVGILVTLVTMGGYVLLIIPGIIITIWLMFASYVVLYENQKGMNALLRSKQLVQGYWWPVFGRLLLMNVIVFVVVGVLNLVTFGIGGSILMIFFYPFMAIYTFEIYNSLKSVKKAEPLDQEKGKTAFKVLAILGLILAPIMIGAAIYQTWTGVDTDGLDGGDSQWEYLQDDYDYYSEDDLDNI